MRRVYHLVAAVGPVPVAEPFPDLQAVDTLLSSLELSDTAVYEPYIRARLGTAADVTHIPCG